MPKEPSRPFDRYAFKIAIICALPLEAEMVESMFDKFWDDEKSYGKAAGDQNAYTTGVIGNHNVVLAHMPGMGGNSAAIVGAGLRSSFRGIEIAFVVGICGVVPLHPQTKEEIILGDCIVSTAVVQYDFGKQYVQGFVRKTSVEDSLGRSNPEIRAFTSMLMTRRNRTKLAERLDYHLGILQDTVRESRYPGEQNDRLFPPSYIHQHNSSANFCHDCIADLGICRKDCKALGCEDRKVVKRQRFGSGASNEMIRVHFGKIGSANTVMKSGSDRDRISGKDDLVAFEMEGSGVWDSFPTIVIKSASDYADSHKSSEWQPYAAATAAAGLKAFLEKWEVTEDPFGHNTQQFGESPDLKVNNEPIQDESQRDKRPREPSTSKENPFDSGNDRPHYEKVPVHFDDTDDEMDIDSDPVQEYIRNPSDGKPYHTYHGRNSADFDHQSPGRYENRSRTPVNSGANNGRLFNFDVPSQTPHGNQPREGREPAESTDSINSGTNDFKFSDANDIFQSFFQTQNQQPFQAAAPPKVTVVERKLPLTLEQFFKGETKRLKIKWKDVDFTTGISKIEENILSLEIKPGYKPGTKIKYKGVGDRERAGRQDLTFVLTEKDHPVFKRVGQDLRCWVTINRKEAVSGWERIVETIDGKYLQVRGVIPTRDGAEIPYPGQGMPKSADPTVRGDMIVQVRVK